MNKKEKGMNINPLFDRIVIEEIKEENSQNGIFLGGVDQDAPKTGIVLAISKNEENQDGKKITFFVKEGDKVLFNKYAGCEFVLDKKPVIIIRQTDILAILEK